PLSGPVLGRVRRIRTGHAALLAGLASDAFESFLDPHRRLRPGIHGFDVVIEAWKAVKQPNHFGPVERVGEHEVDHADVVGSDETAVTHMVFEYFGHRRKVGAGQLDLGGKPLILWIRSEEHTSE